MKYIPRIEEVLSAPPYRLGTNDSLYKFESTRFTIQSSTATLEAIIEQQLHDALPNGTASNNRGDTDVQLKYTPFSTMMLMTFLRYDRVESRVNPTKGWLAYTEVLLGFFVVRELVDSDKPNELFMYLGTVHIDDSYARGQLQDPHTIPIVLGREGFGLPKSPGQILYRPLPQTPRRAWLEIWDNDDADRFELGRAITINPDLPEPVPEPPDSPPEGDPPEPRPVMAWNDPRRWHTLAAALDIDAREVVERLRAETPLGFRTGAHILDVPDGGGEVVVWDDQLYHAQLVGLKQFPDPTTPTGGGDLQSCYTAIVETPLEEDPQRRWPPAEIADHDQIVEFPERTRIDLASAFGIALDPDRRIAIKKGAVVYQHGQLLFAQPDRVTVWTPS